jgi:hypothetical protein
LAIIITEPKNQTMKNIKLTLIFGLLSTHLYSQGIVNGTSDSTSMNYRSIHLKSNYNLFIGCDIGYMVSTYSDIPNIPVQIEYLSSAHVQLSGIIKMSNKGFIKTGLSTHYLRSGLIDGEYHYNSYSSIPFVVTYKRFEFRNDQSLHLMAGPQISFLRVYGYAMLGDDYYELSPGGINTIKAGLTTDVCFFSSHGNWTRTIGIKSIIDLPGTTFNPNSEVVMLDNYISNVLYCGLILKWK